MGRKLRIIRQGIDDLCRQLDNLNVKLIRASEEDQRLFLSEIENVKKALDGVLTEVCKKINF